MTTLCHHCENNYWKVIESLSAKSSCKIPEKTKDVGHVTECEGFKEKEPEA